MGSSNLYKMGIFAHEKVATQIKSGIMIKMQELKGNRKTN